MGGYVMATTRLRCTVEVTAIYSYAVFWRCRVQDGLRTQCAVTDPVASLWFGSVPGAIHALPVGQTPLAVHIQLHLGIG
jgi:hypothetical protein